MTKPPDLFPREPPVRSDFARGGSGLSYAARRRITLSVLAVLLGSGGYWMWNRAFASSPDQIPTITAEGGYKQRPEQPGGIEIPHQDVQVYREIDGSAQTADAGPSIEHMLPPPEEPNPALTNKPAVISSAPANAAPPVENLQPQPMPSALDAPPAPNPVPTTVTPPATLIISPSTAAPPPALSQPQGSRPVPPSPRGNLVVQLAAMPDEDIAKTEAEKMKNHYASILGNVRLRIVKADVNFNGTTFYRIQTEPLAEAQATSICNALKSQKARCFIVHS